MTPLERYYKFYNLSGVPARLLEDQEYYNIYQRPLKEKRSEHPKVIVWKENATQQSDLAEMPIDLKRYHYFLIVIEISKRRVDAEPIKYKFTNSVIKAFIKIYGRGRI
ncbi:hypothetical protein RclHR1_03280025 [Rhizophagus clarus]|uniref:Uncharacterized protein n=1 Tax=Rhizophagus clarus TaxID=94130 RepID=A0A2Z6RNB6_9GLOM|nr:hypothetical protein RclHR1_03280025 [Rhizophagus clarus]GES85556.1 hypothetical protein SAMD00019534_062740 [Rhizophagus clarus]